MGVWYRIKCTGCDYSFVSSAGEASGFFQVVRTMVCNDCQSVSDITTRRFPRGFWFWKPEAEPIVLQCPECSGLDLTPWEQGAVCSKCGGALVRGECVGLWD